MTLTELADATEKKGWDKSLVIVDNATGDEYEYQVYYSEKLDRWELLIDTTPTEPFDHKVKGVEK